MELGLWAEDWDSIGCSYLTVDVSGENVSLLHGATWTLTCTEEIDVLMNCPA